MGYTVPDSQSNFVWATGGPPARETFQKLKDRKILVRLMSYPGYPEGLRITSAPTPRSTGCWSSCAQIA